jgi:phytanoyl-CoA hydroxylase
VLPLDAKIDFETQGYAIARQLFSADEVQSYVEHFMAIHERGGEGYAEGGIDLAHPDPLRRYPRLMQPHRTDKVSMGYMIDPRIREWLTGLLGLEPFGVQTMMYFKPAGARGQALHQDQKYLRVEPGTCVAAWLALDDCTEENGCLQVVPGTQNFPMLCNIPSNSEESFTGDTVPIPDGFSPVMVPMKAGDVLFFNGSLIHGSPPNRSQGFRRILVGHYIVGEAEAVGQWYHPVYALDGTIVELGVSTPGGPCGQFVNKEGALVFEITGALEDPLHAH